MELLVDLLDDDSPVVQKAVRAELASLGRRALPALRRAAKGSMPQRRIRARQLLETRQRGLAMRRLLSYCTRPTQDLESALFLLARVHAPGQDLLPYRRALDAMGAEVQRRIHGKPAGLERALAMVDYLGGELGFSGAENDYHHPDNLHLPRSIERKCGMPLTLCAIYAFVARRAGLSVGILPLPGHVLLQVSDGGETAIIDPFGGGRPLSQADCLAYLSRFGVPYRRRWFLEATDGQMIARQVRNHCESYRRRGLRELSQTLAPLERMLTPRDPQAQRPS